MTTALQMANAECPNLNNGACDGMRLDDKLKFLPGKPRPKCRLASGERCDHFEGCVMPMASYMSDPAKSKAYLDAVAEYKFRHHITGLSRRCPECGGPLPTRKRFCAGCTSKHRRKSTRDAMNRIRGLAVSS